MCDYHDILKTEPAGVLRARGKVERSRLVVNQCQESWEEKGENGVGGQSNLKEEWVYSTG